MDGGVLFITQIKIAKFYRIRKENINHLKLPVPVVETIKKRRSVRTYENKELTI